MKIPLFKTEHEAFYFYIFDWLGSARMFYKSNFPTLFFNLFRTEKAQEILIYKKIVQIRIVLALFSI